MGQAGCKVLEAPEGLGHPIGSNQAGEHDEAPSQGEGVEDQGDQVDRADRHVVVQVVVVPCLDHQSII